jgi:hypothetical protein
MGSPIYLAGKICLAFEDCDVSLSGVSTCAGREEAVGMKLYKCQQAASVSSSAFSVPERHFHDHVLHRFATSLSSPGLQNLS